jgi:hypothetical protein
LLGGLVGFGLDAFWCCLFVWLVGFVRRVTTPIYLRPFHMSTLDFFYLPLTTMDGEGLGCWQWIILKLNLDWLYYKK